MADQPHTTPPRPRPDPPRRLSVVVTCYNEEGNLRELYAALTRVLAAYPDYEIVVVDDGSRDTSLAILRELHAQDPRVKYVSLSRNFGHQPALKAGLDHASGEVVISMDGDLQHPPELIPQLVAQWQAGYDVVATRRADDPRLSWLKRSTSRAFYRLINAVSDIRLEEGMADYRLLDRKVVDVLKHDIVESYLFIRGLVSWVGFRQTTVAYQPAPRFAGQTKYSYRRMLSFALNGITAFSVKPLRIATVLGLLFVLFAIIYGAFALYQYFEHQTVQGWTSVVIIVLLVGGVQILLIGIIGEYLGKLFMQAKGRPHYLVQEAEL